jgi:DNA invertase Pin-like site-specific DNA recombinase
VPLWVPEIGGPIDPDNEAHDLIMSVFGGLSKAERNRVRTRVRTAMAALAQAEGRFLGGRAPYGYRIIDAGPHSHPAKAAEGRRLHVLAVDEPAAAVVRRIYAEYTSGLTMQAVADGLTLDGVPTPAAHAQAADTARPPGAWSPGAGPEDP